MVYEKGEHQVKRVKITDAEAEKNRYYEAVETAFKQLGELHDKALREVGEANAAIFEIHQMMLEDDDYKESVEHIIESQMVNAEYAIAQTGDNFHRCLQPWTMNICVEEQQMSKILQKDC